MATPFRSVCSMCGYCGVPSKRTRGNILIEIVLWLCFMVPGLIYTLWRMTSKFEACPACERESMIAAASPNGAEMIKRAGGWSTQAESNYTEALKRRALISAIKVGVSMAIILYFLVATELPWIGGFVGLYSALAFVYFANDLSAYTHAVSRFNPRTTPPS
jgi:hypothetical protein